MGRDAGDRGPGRVQDAEHGEECVRHAVIAGQLDGHPSLGEAGRVALPSSRSGSYSAVITVTAPRPLRLKQIRINRSNGKPSAEYLDLPRQYPKLGLVVMA